MRTQEQEKALEICRHLNFSIQKSRERIPLKSRANITTNSSACEKELKRKMEQVMKKYNLTKKDL
jgi:hypothetical protein